MTQCLVHGGTGFRQSVPHLLVGRRVLHFIDNTSAVAGLCKGYSNLPDSARLVHAFHAWASRAQADVSFEYVPTDANPSDEPSRVPELWHGDFVPAPGVVSKPQPARFPSISHMHDAHAWRMETEHALASFV